MDWTPDAAEDAGRAVGPDKAWKLEWTLERQQDPGEIVVRWKGPWKLHLKCRTLLRMMDRKLDLDLHTRLHGAGHNSKRILEVELDAGC